MRDAEFRRMKKYSKIKNRIKQQYKYFSKSFAKFYNDVIDGKTHQYLKHTGRVCSCSICKRERYTKRERKYKIDCDE